jgi:hypothetical protein
MAEPLQEYARRLRVARVIHESEHHPDDCPGQCVATAQRVLEALDGES